MWTDAGLQVPRISLSEAEKHRETGMIPARARRGSRGGGLGKGNKWGKKGQKAIFGLIVGFTSQHRRNIKGTANARHSPGGLNYNLSQQGKLRPHVSDQHKETSLSSLVKFENR